MKKLDYEKYKDIKYVSFDIFDTLIKRNVWEPKDVFLIVEKKYYNRYYKRISFYKKRVDAEKECRKNNINEITIDQIYDYIDENNEILKVLKKIEIETELEITQLNYNKEIRDIYEWAIKENKKIIIISDMYLSKEILKMILEKNNIYFDKLYVSSEIGKRKKDGTLFEYVLNDLKINSDEMIHIGDNKNSDYIRAQKNGIKSFLIKKDFVNLSPNIVNRAKDFEKNIELNVLESFINNNICKYDSNLDYFEKFGYEKFGVLLYNFVIWLEKNITAKDIKKVFFLARDGKIIKDVFEKVFKKEIECVYMYASRRALIPPSLWKCNDIFEVMDSINIPSKIKINYLLKRFGVEDIDFNELLKKYGINKNDVYDLLYLKNEKKEFLEELYVYVLENSKIEYKYLKKYFEKINFYGNIAIVDIGWYGNMQKALDRVIDKKTQISGYYIGLRPDCKKNLDMTGYLFEKGKNEYLNEFELYFNAIIETIFSTTHGSVKKFNEKDVELYEYEYSTYEENALNSIQNGVMKFIDDIEKFDLKELIEILEIQDTIYNLDCFLNYPTVDDSIKFGDMLFKDDSIDFIAKKEKKSFLQSFKHSFWKIAFLKRYLKINLPYNKICMFLHIIKKKKGVIKSC